MGTLSQSEARSILLVEDDLLLRDTLVELLADAGYPVIAATDGAEALRLLRSGVSAAVILLDLMMPVMDGWQFRAEQQKDPALADIPVVILTADGRAAQKAEDLNAAGALAKPVDLEDVLSAVEPYLA